MGKSIKIAKIGRKGFNSRKELGKVRGREVETFTALADMVTEFLEIISHTVLFNFGGYAAETDVLANEASDMKRQFQQTVFTLQRGSYIENMKNAFRCEEVRFEIRTKLRGNCEKKLQRRVGEFKWEKCDHHVPQNLHPCGRRIDSKLIEIVAIVRQIDEM
uniref:Uncharacterized protein n=1 Tax=Wuchereria bancrofti TaxID=6293 RepID=A0A1I8EHL8_WUCBA